MYKAFSLLRKKQESWTTTILKMFVKYCEAVKLRQAHSYCVLSYPITSFSYNKLQQFIILPKHLTIVLCTNRHIGEMAYDLLLKFLFVNEPMQLLFAECFSYCNLICTLRLFAFNFRGFIGYSIVVFYMNRRTKKSNVIL